MPYKASSLQLQGYSGRAAVTWTCACIVLAVLCCAISFRLAWVGYIESDDLFYARAAESWLRDGLFVGANHWSLRHCIVLPIAALFWLFGRSETALVLPSLLYAFAFLGLLAHIANRLHGPLAAAATLAIAGSLPVVATGASMVSTDLPEAFFVLASLWAFHQGRQRTGPALLLLSGAMAGCAAITRETTAALLLFYGLLFIANYGRRRVDYVWIALGFLAVVGLDWCYLTAESGDPLYRLHVAQKGAQGDGPQNEALITKVAGLDHFGSLEVARWVKPLVSLLANQSFGLLFWFAIPATVWLCRRRSGQVGTAARLFGGLSLMWLVVAGYLLSPWLWVIPRYFVICTILTVPLAFLLADSLTSRYRYASAAALFLLLSSNMALNLAATTDLMAGEQALDALAATTSETIYTDPATRRSAQWLLGAHGTSTRVASGLPEEGGIYLYNNRPRRALPADWPIGTPPSAWTRLSKAEVRPKWTAPVARLLHLRDFLPSGIVEKLDPPAHVIETYRIAAP